MVEPQRVHGYVVGKKGDRWRVKVTQQGHPLFKQNLTVHSFGNEVKFVTGVNVTFVVGEMDGKTEGEKIPIALDLKVALFAS